MAFSSAVSSTRCPRHADARCTGVFAGLPPELLFFILSLLPVDARARGAAVHPSWRTALEERGLWTRLDLSRASGIPRWHVTRALLRGAAARAGGQLTYLNLKDCYNLTFKDVKEVAQANAAALRTLHLQRKYSSWADFDSDAAHVEVSYHGHTCQELEALLQAAPGLQAPTADLVL